MHVIITNSSYLWFWAYFLIFTFLCIFCIFNILTDIFTYFQHESMMDAMLTTGITRTIAPDPVFLFGLTAGTNTPRNQIPNRPGETLPAFESTFGIAQGFGIFWSTVWPVVAATTRVTMHSYGKRYRTATLASLVNMQFWSICRIRSLDFCMNTTILIIIGLAATWAGQECY